MQNLTILRHPLVDEQVGKLRDKESDIVAFRSSITRLGYLLAVEALKDAPVFESKVTTPMEVESPAIILKDEKILLVPILRAGLGLVESFLTFLPKAKVAHIGMSRDHETLEAKLYVNSLPRNVADFEQIIVLDPMLATGGSMIATIDLLKQNGCTHFKVIVLVAAPEGVQALAEAHPDVELYCASVDERLDEHGYIIPGLGDAGDKIFGTK